MITPKTLTKPPIKEAVLEVLFDYHEPMPLNLLNEYGSLISSRYPTKETIEVINANFSNENQKVSRNKIGFVHFSENKKTAIQTRVNGFAYAQANRSYTSWDIFKPAALNELGSFIEFATPARIKRFSLRFINQINIPPSADLKEYLVFLPNIDSINLPIRDFVFRVELNKTEIGALAIISQLFSPPFEPTINVYLDIDVIINESAPREPNMDYLSEGFEKLRDLKNQIFFSSITEKTINLYS